MKKQNISIKIPLREELRVLGLSLKEEKVLLALQSGEKTVLDIARATRVSRPSVYDILLKLRQRGLVSSKIVHGRKSWHIASEKELADTLYALKKKLLAFSDGKEEVGGVTDGVVVVYRGDKAVKETIFRMFKMHQDERFLAYSGFTDAAEGWYQMFTPEEVNETNRVIKKNRIIAEAVFPCGWADDNFELFGKEWAKDYEGRSASTVYIDKQYFTHGGQLFAFKDSLYLLALKDKLIIEIRHSDIQKMVLAMYSFMKDNGKTIDINRRLRELMGGKES